MKKHLLLLFAFVAFGTPQIKAQQYFVGSVATPGAATFSVGQDENGVITLPFHATTRTLEAVTNQTNFSVNCVAEWCKVERNGNTLTLSVTQNDGDDAREAIVAIYSKDFQPLSIVVRQEARLAFAVISDTHVGNKVGEGPMKKVPQALQHLTATFTTLGEKDPSSDKVPEPTGYWTFENAKNLTEGTGTTSLRGAIMQMGSPTFVNELASANISTTAGPDSDNSAISVPIASGLRMDTNLGTASPSTYSFMLDILIPAYSDGQHYTNIFQNDLTNKKDGSFFEQNGKLGLGGSHGLGYNGNFTFGQWHRLVFVVKDNFATIYLDGNYVSRSSSACAEHWQLGTGILFFLDNDQEEHEVHVAELCFWNKALTDFQVKLLGAVNTTFSY